MILSLRSTNLSTLKNTSSSRSESRSAKKKFFEKVVHQSRKTKNSDTSTRRDSSDFEFTEAEFSQRVDEQSKRERRERRDRDRSRERERGGTGEGSRERRQGQDQVIDERTTEIARVSSEMTFILQF